MPKNTKKGLAENKSSHIYSQKIIMEIIAAAAAITGLAPTRLYAR